MIPKVTNVLCEMDVGAPFELGKLVEKPQVQALIKTRKAVLMGGGRIEIQLSTKGAKAILHETGKITITGESDIKSAKAAARSCCSKLRMWNIAADPKRVIKTFRMVSASGAGELGYRIKVIKAAKMIPGACICPKNDLLLLNIDMGLERPVPVKCAFNGKIALDQAKEPCQVVQAIHAAAPMLARFKLA